MNKKYRCSSFLTTMLDTLSIDKYIIFYAWSHWRPMLTMILETPIRMHSVIYIKLCTALNNFPPAPYTLSMWHICRSIETCYKFINFQNTHFSLIREFSHTRLTEDSRSMHFLLFINPHLILHFHAFSSIPKPINHLSTIQYTNHTPHTNTSWFILNSLPFVQGCYTQYTSSLARQP